MATDARQPRRDQCARAVPLVEREGERTRSRRQGVAFAFVTVEFFAQALDLRLRRGHLRLRGLVGGVEVRVAGVAERGLGFERAELGLHRGPAVAGGVDRVLLAQHLAAHRREAGGGRLGVAGELGNLEIVPGHQR